MPVNPPAAKASKRATGNHTNFQTLLFFVSTDVTSLVLKILDSAITSKNSLIDKTSHLYTYHKSDGDKSR